MDNKYVFIEQFKERTKFFALNIITLYQKLPRSGEAKVIGNQLLRSATSVAANYRAASRSRSKKEFYHKMCIVVEEADESVFWLELLQDAKLISTDDIYELIVEANEILKIVAKARVNSKEGLKG